MLPEGWRKTKLPEIAWYQEGPGLRKWQFQDHGCKVLNITNIEYGKINKEKTNRYISWEEVDSKYKHFLCDENDIVIASSGNSYCKHGIIKSEDLPLVMNTSVIRFKPHSGTSYGFLNQYLKSSFLKSQIDTLITGGAQPNFGPSHLEQIVLLVPPLSEQKKIAAILSTWDRAIEGTEKLLANSQQQKKALMQQLLTGKKRLPGFSGEWKIGTLSEIAHIDTGFAFKSSEFTDNANDMPIVRMSDLKEGTLHLENCKRLHLNSLSGLEKFSLKEKDFIFGMSGSLSNFAWVKKSNLPCYLNQRVGRIRSKKTGDQEFISYLYLSEKIQKEIEDKAAGAAQLNISLNDIRSMKIQIPPLSEQKAIAAVLTTADEEITALESDLSRLRQEKKALMQQLLTGKRRVTVD